MGGIVLSFSISSPLLVCGSGRNVIVGTYYILGLAPTWLTSYWASGTSSFPIGSLEGVTGGLTVHQHVSVLGEKTLSVTNPPTWDTRVFCWGEPFGIHMEPITLMYIVLSVIKTYWNGQEVINTQTWTWSNKHARMKHYLVGEVVG